jgi:CubicO group peptidase (beta-lactamase class C family)
MAIIEGTCDERFGALQRELTQCLEVGDELGASIVVDLDGEIAVDMWGGFRDEARTQPWQRDTITNVWSTTKTVTISYMMNKMGAGLVGSDRAECYLRAIYGALAD